MVFKTGAKRLKKLHQKISKKIKIKNSLKKKKEIRKEFANRLVLETHQNVTNEKKKKREKYLEAVNMLLELKVMALTEAEWALISPMASHVSVDQRRSIPPRHPDTTIRPCGK